MPDTSNQSAKRLERHDWSPTILIVGDDGMRHTLVHNLRLDGYFVLEACDGAEALRIVIGQSRPIHVLLTDVSVHGTSLS
jgi:CheY-like chemotaxis protein